MSQHLRENKIRHQLRTIDKILAWASQVAGDSVQDGPLHHAIWTDLEELYQQFRRRISAVERELAGDWTPAAEVSGERDFAELVARAQDSVVLVVAW